MKVFASSASAYLQTLARLWLDNTLAILSDGDQTLIKKCEDLAEEEHVLVALLRQIQEEQGSLASTCITARTNAMIRKLGQLLQSKGIRNRVIEADDPSDPSLRLKNALGCKPDQVS